jgi:mannitol-specific phosphotransferase system IIBC component
MTANNSTVLGTVGGTLLCVLSNMESGDIIKTVILAAIGAVVSFTVSVVLRIIERKHRE